MNYDSQHLIETSAEIAREAHAGQEHGFGDGSYFDMHIEPVANVVRRLGYGALYIATAYLHDTDEDTWVTLDYLRAREIPEEVVHGVDLLSKKDEQDQVQYINGVLSDPLATVGKFADSSFNFAWTILNSPNARDDAFIKRTLEYSYNLRLLRLALPQPL